MDGGHGLVRRNYSSIKGEFSDTLLTSSFNRAGFTHGFFIFKLTLQFLESKPGRNTREMGE